MLCLCKLQGSVNILFTEMMELDYSSIYNNNIFIKNTMDFSRSSKVKCRYVMHVSFEEGDDYSYKNAN